MSTEETRNVVAGYVDALRRGDIDALRASFAPKATWTIRGDVPVAGTWTGPDEILDGFLAEVTATPHHRQVHAHFAAVRDDGENIRVAITPGFDRLLMQHRRERLAQHDHAQGHRHARAVQTSVRAKTPGANSIGHNSGADARPLSVEIRSWPAPALAMRARAQKHRRTG